MERVVEVASPAAAARLERLESQVAQLSQERLELQRWGRLGRRLVVRCRCRDKDCMIFVGEHFRGALMRRHNMRLTDALAAATAAAQAAAREASAERAAAAAEGARRQEREAAAAAVEARLQAAATALEEERRQQLHLQQQHRDCRCVLLRGTHECHGVALASVHILLLRLLLLHAPCLRYCSKPKLSVVVSGAEEVAALRAKLAAAQRREREAEARAEAAQAETRQAAAAAAAAAAAPAAAETQRLHAWLESAQAESDMLRSRLAQQEREQERQQGSSSPSRRYTTIEAAAAAAGVLDAEVQRLREEAAALRQECRQLRQQSAQDVAETKQQSQQQQPAVQGGLGSPIEESRARADHPAGAAAEPSSAAHTAADPSGHVRVSITAANIGRPGSARCRQPVGSPTRAGDGGGGGPSLGDRRHFRRELCCTLHTAERPGVVSRFPHSLGAFLAMRADLQVSAAASVSLQGNMHPGWLPSTGRPPANSAPPSLILLPLPSCPSQGELEDELAAELASYGLDPAAQGLPDRHYERALSELEARREAARRGMSPTDRGRMDYMRSTAAWHVQRVRFGLRGRG